MDKKKLDQIEREIEAGAYCWEDTMNLPQEVQMELSKRKADREYDEVRSRLDFEDRDWSRAIESCWICGIMGEAVYCNSHLMICRSKDAVVILGWDSAQCASYEFFKSREKLDSFIAALNKMWDRLEQERAQKA